MAGEKLSKGEGGLIEHAAYAAGEKCRAEEEMNSNGNARDGSK
jgi:hypothetical protein